MATRPRSQSATPKPPSPSPPHNHHEPTNTSSSNSNIITSTPKQTSETSLSSESHPPERVVDSSTSASSPINFNTNMFAQASSTTVLRDPIPSVLPVQPYDPHVTQGQGQDFHPRDTSPSLHTHAAAPPSYSSLPHAAAGDYYNSTNQHANGATGPSIIPSYSTARSMSIQSLVSTTSSTTAGNSSVADDDSVSVVSHTTTRNTEEDEDTSSISVDIDDPDVRMAAEALGDLRADFVSSPKSPPNSPPQKAEPRQESMMEMIQGQNTFLGTAMRAGRSVYRGGKRYSPRFKYGAEMMERAAAPMTSVVSYAARTTGVESVLRRNLEARRLSSSGSSQTTSTSPSQSQTSSSTSSHATKRRKTTFEDGTAMDVDSENQNSHSHATHDHDSEQPLTHKPATDVVSLNWQRRLMLSTAGVGVALSEESLKSLKYCLAWLRWANDHLDKVIMALRGVISEYDSSKSRNGAGGGPGLGGPGSEEQDERSIVLQNKIENLRKDVIGTLKKVVDVVSTYAGGALPENARVVVKACITNLPRRWALAAKDDNANSTGANGNSKAVVVRREEAGKKVLVLAREGLEMLHQVSAIVQLTLERAEEWCDRLGRKKPEEGDYGKVGWDVDVEMDGMEGRKDR
ncbi:hypothetical protein ABW19_dt0210082 [Dactylella cylindrospora]|nr:hypothetical protein ABW19_dt0210082 [Dactylella cylindrospora]